MRRRFGIMLALVAFLVLLVSAAGCKSATKAYPNKSIALVYHSKAGSGGDIFLRNLSKALEKQFGQSIMVENRVGGGGSTSWSYVAKAQPDGYTMLGVSSTIVAGPIQTPMDVGYKTFKPVAQIFYDPTVIFVSSKSTFTKWQDIVDAAKASETSQKWGGGSPGSVESLCIKQIAKMAGMNIDVIPFEGGGDVAVEVMAGRLAAGIGEYAEISGLVKSGDLKILVGLGNERIPSLSDIPTLKESGVDFAFEKVRGIMAPKDVPDAIIQKWVDAIKKVYDDADFKKYYTESNIIPLFRGPADMLKALDAQDAFLRSASK